MNSSELRKVVARNYAPRLPADFAKGMDRVTLVDFSLFWTLVIRAGALVLIRADKTKNTLKSTPDSPTFGQRSRVS